MSKHPFTPFSLAATAALAALLGAGSVALPRHRAPAPAAAPELSARIALAEPASEGSGVTLSLTLVNRGGADAIAPLDGVLSLTVTSLDHRVGIVHPAFLAATDIVAPASGPLTLPPGATHVHRVRLASVAPFDRPGRYRLAGELLGPSGVIAIEPIGIVVEPATTLARR